VVLVELRIEFEQFGGLFQLGILDLFAQVLSIEFHFDSFYRYSNPRQPGRKQKDYSDMRKEPAYKLNSVDRALVLLHLLRDQGSITVSEAAATLDVGVSTAHRLLAMLVFRDFASQDDGRVYRAGPALGISAGPGQRVALLRRALHVPLDRLRDATGETANLSVRVGSFARIVAAAESSQALHVGNQVGTLLPAHLSAAGKAELACLSDDEVMALLQAAERADGVTIDAPAVLSELQASRVRGYAVNDGKAEPGISAVGVPLLSQTGAVVGAISVAVPSFRFNAEVRDSASELLIKTAHAVRPTLAFD
jgi:DNA-binding IclR family transcriptional regulator